MTEKGHGEVGQMDAGCRHAGNGRFGGIQPPIAGIKRSELVVAEIAFNLLNSSKLP